MPDKLPLLAVFRRSPPRARRRDRALVRGQSAGRSRRRRRRLPRARAKLGRDGWLAHTAPDPDAPAPLDVRTLCLMRETLARHDGLADFAFAMQGLGAGPISLFGNAAQRQWLKRTRAGDAIAAFALTEQKSGSDVANIATDGEARRRRLCPRRRKDLDFERRHRRSLRRVCPNRRRPRRQGAFRLSAAERSGRLLRRRTHRGDRAASAGAHEIRARARSRRPP